jgi:hypothetical protein
LSRSTSRRTHVPLEARAELISRYLAAFGPSSLRDIVRWSMMHVPELKASLATLESLRRFRDEQGRELFDVPRGPLPDSDTPAPVRFLPKWDNVLLAWADRTRVLPEAYRKRVIGMNGDVAQTFLVDGFVAGTWNVEQGRVRTKPFGRLSPVQAAGPAGGRRPAGSLRRGLRCREHASGSVSGCQRPRRRSDMPRYLLAVNFEAASSTRRWRSGSPRRSRPTSTTTRRSVASSIESGERVQSEVLAGPDLAKIVTSDGKAPVVTDGPFQEFKEWLAGFQVVDVESEARALEIAARLSAVPGRAASRCSSRSRCAR